MSGSPKSWSSVPRSEGAQLVGPGGLLSDLTKTVLETALEVEMEDQLGYAKHAPGGA